MGQHFKSEQTIKFEFLDLNTLLEQWQLSEKKSCRTYPYPTFEFDGQVTSWKETKFSTTNLCVSDRCIYRPVLNGQAESLWQNSLKMSFNRDLSGRVSEYIEWKPGFQRERLTLWQFFRYFTDVTSRTKRFAGWTPIPFPLMASLMAVTWRLRFQHVTPTRVVVDYLHKSAYASRDIHVLLNILWLIYDT